MTQPNAAQPRLQLQNVHVGYGQHDVLHGINLEVKKGEIVTLIGANGAGKSTLLMAICGDPAPSQGTVLFDGEPLNGLPTYKIMRKGLAQSPEGRRIFPRMTVLENLQIGASLTDQSTFNRDLERVFHLFPILSQRQSQRGGTLSGGEQQMLAIARALMSRPRLLLLDEPSLGLAPLISQTIFKALRTLNEEEGLTLLLVEQNAYHALKLAHRAYVLVNGHITMQGTGQELLGHPDVRAAYLEGGHHA